MSTVPRHSRSISWRPRENTQTPLRRYLYRAYYRLQILDLSYQNYLAYHSTQVLGEPELCVPLPRFLIRLLPYRDFP